MKLPRYLGVWSSNPASLHPIADLCLPNGLDPILEAPDCRIYLAGQTGDYHKNSERVLIGRAYGRTPGFPLLEAADSLRQSCDPKADLWGDYLVIEPHRRDRIRITRSALGRLPCYFSTVGTLTLFSSDIDLLELSHGKGFDPDWAAIAHHLCHPHLRVPRTCLVGVTELLGGQSLTISATERTITSDWTPWIHARHRHPIAPPETAASRIRTVTLQTIRSLAASRQHIVLGVSGGLDSSIVAAALSNAGARVTLVTLASADPRGDERHYARILAAGLGLPLIERIEDIDLVDPFISQSTHLPRPIGRSFAQSTDRILTEVAKDCCADCHFTGGGGDNVFCYLQSAAPIADLLKRGRFVHALRCATDIGTITGAGTLKAFRLALKRAWLRPAAYHWRLDLRYLSPGVTAKSAEISMHPWLAAPKGALPGTAAHIAAILAIENHLEGFGRELSLPVISPLVSKPIVDTAVGIPSWMWCANGRNRAVARAAFADLLPAEIIERQSKGTPDGVAAAVFERHRRQIGEFLCDGLLAGQEIVDREAIAIAIRQEGPARGYEFARLLTLCDVEAWTRAITARQRMDHWVQPAEHAMRDMPRRSSRAPHHPSARS